jgi:hypothetical protein
LGRNKTKIFLHAGLDRPATDLPVEVGQELGFFES